jgi:hypothetical protein
MSEVARGNRRQSQTSADNVRAPSSVNTAIGAQPEEAELALDTVGSFRMVARST